MIKYDLINFSEGFKTDQKTGWERGVLQNDLYVSTGVNRREKEQVRDHGLSPEWAADVSIDEKGDLVGSGKMIFGFPADEKKERPNKKHHMLYPSKFYVVWKAPAGTEYWSKGGKIGNSEIGFPYLVEPSDIKDIFDHNGKDYVVDPPPPK